MAQNNYFNHRDIDTDSDSDSNNNRSGNIHFVGTDSTKKTTRRRSTSHHLLMDAIEGSDEEKVPLPDYERLSQSMRLPQDMVQEPEKPNLTLSPSNVQQKPIARKLIDKMFKKDGEKEKDSKDKEKDKEKEKEIEKDGVGSDSPAKKGKKKRSSWMPDPEKRWPVQGWS